MFLFVDLFMIYLPSLCSGLSLTGGGGSHLQSSLLSSLQQTGHGNLGKHKSFTGETTLSGKKKTKVETTSHSLSGYKGANSLPGSKLDRTSVGSSASGRSLQSNLIGSIALGRSSLLSTNQSANVSLLGHGSSYLGSQSKQLLQTQPKAQLSSTLIGQSALTGCLKTGFSSHGLVVPGQSSLLSRHLSTEKTSLLGTSSLSPKMVTSVSKISLDKTPEKRARNKSSEKSKKTKSKVVISEEKMQMLAMTRYQIEIPEYDLSRELPMDIQGREREDFMDVDKDPFLNRIQKPLHDVNGMKVL